MPIIFVFVIVHWYIIGVCKVHISYKFDKDVYEKHRIELKR